MTASRYILCAHCSQNRQSRVQSSSVYQFSATSCFFNKDHFDNDRKLRNVVIQRYMSPRYSNVCTRGVYIIFCNLLGHIACSRLAFLPLFLSLFFLSRHAAARMTKRKRRGYFARRCEADDVPLWRQAACSITWHGHDLHTHTYATLYVHRPALNRSAREEVGSPPSCMYNMLTYSSSLQPTGPTAAKREQRVEADVFFSSRGTN